MQMMKRMLGLALVAILSVGGAVAVQPAGVALAASTASTASARSQILADTNAARAKQGLPALSVNADMNSVAQKWAKKMAAANALEHNANYSSQIPAGWTRAGENIAVGFDDDSVTGAWMDSTGHRANILGDYTRIGIGYFVDSDGREWAVQDFAKYSGSPSTKAPSRVAKPAVVGVATRRLKITWKAPKSGTVRSYRVVVMNSDGVVVQTIKKTAGSRKATTRALTMGETYRVKVRASNSAGQSVYSALSSPDTIRK